MTNGAIEMSRAGGTICKTATRAGLFLNFGDLPIHGEKPWKRF
jgi:hypothetical protein